MNATAIQFPTLSNPDAFDDVAELRRELHSANDQILRLAGSLSEASNVAASTGSALAIILWAHVNRDPHLGQMLDDLSVALVAPVIRQHRH